MPTTTLLQRAATELEDLTDEQLRQVLEFVEALKNKFSPAGVGSLTCVHRSPYFAWYTVLPREGISWAFEYLDALLDRLLGELQVPPPAQPIQVELHAAEAPIVYGEARPNGLVFWRGGGTFMPDLWSRWIFAHELCNLLVAHAASPGMPVDWWANRASPYPLAASAELMAEMGFAAEAAQILAPHEREAPVRMFRQLFRDFGWSLFARAFALMRADQMVWVRLPNPSALLSHYVCAYLQAGAGRDLGLYMALGGVGSRPPQWDEFHPGQPFEAYAIDPAWAAGIWAARERLQAAPPGDERVERGWQAYRVGRHELVASFLEDES